MASLWHQRELISEEAWLSEDSNSFLNNLQAKMPNIIHLFLDPTRLHLLPFFFYKQKAKYNMPIMND